MMRCFYEMDELKIGLQKEKRWFIGESDVIEHMEDKLYTSRTTDSWGNVTEKSGTFTHRTYTAKDGAKIDWDTIYTMRVCKQCRGDWMQAIKIWFHNPPPMNRESCGSGIFVRREGRSVEITREEWDSLNPGREPVIWKG